MIWALEEEERISSFSKQVNEMKQILKKYSKSDWLERIKLYGAWVERDGPPEEEPDLQDLFERVEKYVQFRVLHDPHWKSHRYYDPDGVLPKVQEVDWLEALETDPEDPDVIVTVGPDEKGDCWSTSFGLFDLLKTEDELLAQWEAEEADWLLRSKENKDERS